MRYALRSRSSAAEKSKAEHRHNRSSRTWLRNSADDFEGQVIDLSNVDVFSKVAVCSVKVKKCIDRRSSRGESSSTANNAESEKIVEKSAVCPKTSFLFLFAGVQDRHERFLRDVDVADRLHSFLTLFLFGPQFSLSRNVATLTFAVTFLRSLPT